MNAPVVLAERYELLDVIGRGGMADVHRASDRLLDRQVAVKVLRDSAEDDTDRARFTSEARTLAALSHSGLVMVLDAGIDAEHPWLVMELVEGRTLAQACAGGPLPVEVVGSVGIQVAEALGYAHGQGVIHRDVKPGNVLLGAEDRVKLADFGIARLIGDTVRHTRTGHAVGTAAYLSPEQVTGTDVTPAADVYSLGLVLLEALTGERAYPGASTEAALARLSRPPVVPAALPGGWHGLLTAMTALDPAARPTAEQVAAQLRSEPTAPVPVATVRPPEAAGSLPSAHVQEAEPPTRTLTEPVAAAASPSALPDRVGESLSRLPGRGADWARGLPPHQRGLAAALLALLALIAVVGIAAGGSAGDRSDVPEDTPAELREPLGDLHDAVNGE